MPYLQEVPSLYTPELHWLPLRKSLKKEQLGVRKVYLGKASPHLALTIVRIQSLSRYSWLVSAICNNARREDRIGRARGREAFVVDVDVRPVGRVHVDEWHEARSTQTLLQQNALCNRTTDCIRMGNGAFADGCNIQF